MVDEKKFDVLDDVKAAEKKIKRAAFLKLIPKLKEMAKEVNTLKKRAELLLEETGIEEKDRKRVIDFINSLPTVELSESDLKELREGVKEEVHETREKAEKDFDKSLEKFSSAMATSMDNAWMSTGGTANTAYCSTVGAGSNMTLSSNGKSLNVDI